jgi:hypothetical protein
MDLLMKYSPCLCKKGEGSSAESCDNAQGQKAFQRCAEASWQVQPALLAAAVIIIPPQKKLASDNANVCYGDLSPKPSQLHLRENYTQSTYSDSLLQKQRTKRLFVSAAWVMYPGRTHNSEIG